MKFFTAFLLISIISFSTKAQNIQSSVLGTHEKMGNSVTFSLDGSMMASGSDDNRVMIWNAEGKTKKTITAHSIGVKDVKFSIDGKFLFTAGRDNLIRMWSTETWKQSGEFTGHKEAVNRLAVHPDGIHLFSCSDDLTIKKWNIASKKVVSEYKGHKDRVLSIDLNSDGSLMVSTSGDKVNKSLHNLMIWNTTTAEITYKLDEEQYAIQDAKFNQNGKMIVYGGIFSEVHLIDIEGKVLAKKSLTQFGLNSVLISGTTIYSASTFSGEVSIWPLGKEVQVLQKHNDSANLLALYKKKLLSIGTDGKVILWELP